MSIPPVPNHPPRPGRRKPAEESPDSITTQLFIGQDKSPAADGSTQALSADELARLRSMVSSDGADATEVLSLDELRQLAAAENEESALSGPTPRKARSEDIAEAEAASAPKQWNPQGASGGQPPNPEPWGADFGAPGQPAPQPHPPEYPGNESHVPNGASPYAPHAAAAYAGHGGPGPAGVGHGPGVGPGGQGGPAGQGGPVGPGGPAGPNGGGYGPGGPGGYGPGGYGPGGPAGPGGPYRREPDTKKVPGWLWALAAIALVIALGIVGYIAWDATQSKDDAAPGSSSQGPSDDAGSKSDDSSSKPPVAAESFKSPSGNIACTIDADRTRCVISAFDYTPPAEPDDCQLDNWGGVVVANDEGAGFSCQEAPGNSGPARVLGYGESITAEGMTCTSTREGMTCKSDETGVGFNMARASVDFLD
ncbi:DUF6636 domain-containing protein [Brevibacterium sp. UCMA 11752]|uniref:DUF6636 domain-containing protein n=1 Tax=Brevibacterium sp. UCMA 11752 TaxID=2745946 RepID=UPI001F458CF6|nr:DUF6636 domain-containing protein [Brevibacterium sp. UCMA 11752]MCF2587917.1 hypothetical protein [Brevibacterium sp. UCMA 11752]